MTKISVYNIDENVTADDKWIGTDVNTYNKTKNFTPRKLSNYFNGSQVINTGVDLLYKYFTITPPEERPSGTLSFETEIGATVDFSDINTFLLSKTTLKGNDVSEFLDFLVNSISLIYKAKNINLFGSYKIVSVDTYFLDPNFFVVTVDFLEGNGFIEEDEDYMISVVDLDKTIPIPQLVKETFDYTSSNSFVVANEINNVLQVIVNTTSLHPEAYSYTLPSTVTVINELFAGDVITVVYNYLEEFLEVPDLQRVTSVGNHTTNNIVLDNLPGENGDYTTINTLNDLGTFQSFTSPTNIDYQTEYAGYGMYINEIYSPTESKEMLVAQGFIQTSYTNEDTYNSILITSSDPAIEFGKNGFIGKLKSDNIEANITLQFPDKPLGTYTIATTEDVPPFTPSDYDLDEFTNTNADPFAKISDLPTYSDFIQDSITNGVVDKAPTENAVYDALQLKQNSLGYTPVNKAGDTMSGDLILNRDPDVALGAATKQYVDNISSGINFHEPVVVATDTPLVATYNNGTAGVGATLTGPSVGALSIDGEFPAYLDRVLVWQQANPIQNGIYDLTTVGDSVTVYQLTRSTDADNSPPGEMRYGDYTFTTSGDINGGRGFICNTTGTIVIGTTPITFVQFNSAQIVTPGYGLENTSPNVIAIDPAVTQEKITLTTTGSSGAATFTGNTLNIPESTTPALVFLNEGNGIGIVISGRNPLNYGNVGLGAVDLSVSDTASSNYGATGPNSFAVGQKHKVSGARAFSTGDTNIVSGNNSAAFGAFNSITGYNSIISGWANSLSGTNSLSIGTNITSTGDNSISIGDGVVANAYASSAFGYAVYSKSFSESVFGVKNTLYTPISTTSFNPLDRVFGVGNGDLTRSDAFIILKNGLATLPSVTNALIDGDTTGKAVVTKEYLSTSNYWTKTGNDIQNNNTAIVKIGGTVSNGTTNQKLHVNGAIICSDRILTTSSNGFVFGDAATGMGVNGNEVRFTSYLGTIGNAWNFNPIYLATASGNLNILNFSSTINPTSGTGIFNTFNISPTINQTGGANGITRGLYINPTLTAAADFRAIEVVTGKVIVPTATNSNEAINKGQLESYTTAQLTGKMNNPSLTPFYIPRAISATTIGNSRLWDTDTYLGIGVVNSPTKDITLGYQNNREFGIEQSDNTTIGRDLIVTAGRTINYVPNTNFNALSVGLGGYGITSDSSSNVYFRTYGGLIYKQTGGVGSFTNVGNIGAAGYAIQVAANGNIYATGNGFATGDIYMAVSGSYTFTALVDTPRDWLGLGVALNGDVYATTFAGGLYKRAGGIGLFVLDTAAPINIKYVACAVNGDIYITGNNKLYRQAGGVGPWVDLLQTSRAYTHIACSPNGNIYVYVTNGDIYNLVGGAGSLIALGQTFSGITGLCFIANGNAYAVTAADIYLQQNYVVGTANLQGGTLKLTSGTGKGTGASNIELYTGQVLASGTDMQTSTLRAKINNTGLMTLPSVTNALIEADTTGKSVATKEYVNNRLVLEKSGNYTLTNADSGGIIIFTASATLTIPNLLADGFECTFVTLASATLTVDRGSNILYNNTGTVLLPQLSFTLKRRIATDQYITAGSL